MRKRTLATLGGHDRRCDHAGSGGERRVKAALKRLGKHRTCVATATDVNL